MLNKIIKLLGIMLMGATLLASSSSVTYAQYYTYYTPLNVTTTNASNITSSSAVLNGLVNGTNLYSTYNVETWFQYGTDPSFGYSTLHINSNSGYANYSLNVANLSPSTVYYFRAIGQNAQGVVYGNTNSFRTNFGSTIDNSATIGNGSTGSSVNPTIVTNPATSVSSTGAKLNSLIINSPNDPATTWFEWGTIPTLGNITPLVGLGTLPSAKHINTITGLAPHTTYYYRAVVQNSSSRVNGTTLSFTTNNAVSQSATVNTTTTDTTVTNTNKDNVSNTSVLEPVGSALGANAIGSGTFFPVTALGWLVLIILVLSLILLAKYFHQDVRGQKPTATHGHV